jgi:hypothetical protein
MDKHFASMASQLAVTMIFDLGLQLPPPEVPSGLPSVIYAPSMTQQSCRVERTMEEQRAVLGAFVITSMVSHSFKAADGLRWSPHLEEYLAHLCHHSTLSQDKILVTQVKMQLMVNQVRYSSWNPSNVEIPPYVDALQSQLDDIAGVVSGASVAFGNNCK